MRPTPRCAGLVILAGLIATQESTVHAEQPAPRDFASLRAWMESQPGSLENEVLFDDGRIVRSERFTTAGTINREGDFDGDGDVDISDYRAMHFCLRYSGPEISTPPPCYVFDFDGDFDVDLDDMSGFIAAFTGPGGAVLVEAGSLVPILEPPSAYYSGEPGIWGNNALNGAAAQSGYSQSDFWYEWSVSSQPGGSRAIIIANSAQPTTAYTILQPVPLGDYVFRLRVTNLITSEFGLDTVTLHVYDCFVGDDCDDDSLCTDDACVRNVCLNLPLFDCDDGVACTTDTCDGVSGACTHSDNCPPPAICNLQSGQCQ